MKALADIAAAGLAETAAKVREAISRMPDAELLAWVARPLPTEALREELEERATKVSPPSAEKEAAKSSPRPTRAADDLSASPLQARVFEQLRRGPQSSTEVADALNIERRLAGMTLQRLFERHLVTKPRRGGAWQVA